MTATTENPSAPVEQTEFATKREYRKKVWNHLQQNDLASYPRPAYGRIPNYKNSNEAAEKLLELEAFQNAKYVQVNADKALEHCRVLTLANGKDLFVPVPKLKDGLLKKWLASDNNNEQQIKRIVNRWGIEYTGQPIGLNDEQKVHIDLYVLGSVAVSRNGRRIGKGRGFADLEFAILKEMNAIDEETIIATVVHDSQVFDNMPDELFEKFDVPVDFILTPTELIEVETKLPRPEGIFWELLTERRLKTMDILVKLYEKQKADGKEVELKQEDSETEERRRPFHHNRRFQRNRYQYNNRRRRPYPNQKRSISEDNADKINEQKQEKRTQPRRNRFNNRQRRYSKTAQSKSPATRNQSNENKKRSQQRRKQRLNIDFSLVVSNISKNVRVRDLKSALAENGIKPYDITWRGMRGFCYLHYMKPRNNNNNDEKIEEGKSEGKSEEKTEKTEQKQYAVDDVIDILQKMKITPDAETNLDVKVYEPITRIEITDVTAV